MGHILLLALALSDVRPECVHRDTVSVVETNHFYNEDGVKVFDQLIAWDWCNDAERFQVRAWRLWRPLHAVHAAEWKGVIIWMDGEKLRVLKYGSRRESWTQYDPELNERQTLATDARKELSR